MREERRVVTALFADLVGSTALGERLDPEDVRLIVGEAIARMIGAVESFGGTVKDLAGDGVLALFGAPVAHEDDAERAVRAALLVVDEIGATRTRSSAAFGLGVLRARRGRHRPGRARAGRRRQPGRVRGARRRGEHGRATPGRTPKPRRCWWAGDRSRVEPLFAWGEARELELKGKAEPVTAYRVDGVLAAPGDARELEAIQMHLVGRERELATARGRRRRARRRRRDPVRHR